MNASRPSIVLVFEFRQVEAGFLNVLGFISVILKFALDNYPESRFSFLGKSIGTQAFCYLESEAMQMNLSLADSKFIWLTPVWSREKYLQYMINFKNKSLFIIGDNDDHYSFSACQKIRSNSNSEVVVIERADHSLDNDLSVEETFLIHREVFNQICNFLSCD